MASLTQSTLQTQRRSPIVVWSLLVAALFVALTSVLCLIVNWRYAIFRNGVDLGIFTQVVSRSSDRGFSSSVEGRVNHLLVHWSPIVAVGWPFVRAFGPLGLEVPSGPSSSRRFSFPIGIFGREPNWCSPCGVRARCRGRQSIHPVGERRRRFSRDGLRAASICGTRVCDGSTALAPQHLYRIAFSPHERRPVVLAANGLIFAMISRADARARRAGLPSPDSRFQWRSCISCSCVLRSIHTSRTCHSTFSTGPGVSPKDTASSLSMLLPRAWYESRILRSVAFLPCISRYGLFLIPGLRRDSRLAPNSHARARRSLQLALDGLRLSGLR